ncbi:MAG: FG-GAP repeat domain-containing protein, partial [Verrucomicrobiia bacterium]
MRIITIILLSTLFAGAAEERRFASHERLSLGTGSETTASLRIGDLDGDNDLDIAVANGRHWPHQNIVLFNQGRARFNLIRPLGQDMAASYATELADLDNDGDLDIAVGNDNAPNVIFLNDGQGTFQRHATFGTPSSIRSLT